MPEDAAVPSDVVEELDRRIAALERTIARLQRPIAPPTVTEALTASSPEALFAAAVSAEQRGATDVALTLYGQVQQLWPTDDWATGARVRRAEILQRQGVLIDAMDELLYVIESHPDSVWAADAYLALARGLLVMGRSQEAERLLRDLVMLFPQSGAAVEGAALLADLLESPAAVSGAVGATASVTSGSAAVSSVANGAEPSSAATTEPVIVAPPPQ